MGQVSSLKFTGATSSSFTIPGTEFTFQEFKLNGSVTLGGRSTINYLNLKGGADLAGIGKADGVFTYKDSNLAFSLKLAPKFPPPFKEVRAILPIHPTTRACTACLSSQLKPHLKLCMSLDFPPSLPPMPAPLTPPVSDSSSPSPPHRPPVVVPSPHLPPSPSSLMHRFPHRFPPCYKYPPSPATRFPVQDTSSYFSPVHTLGWNINQPCWKLWNWHHGSGRQLLLAAGVGSKFRSWSVIRSLNYIDS